MPRVSNVPPSLKPYRFHGLDLSWSPSSSQAVGECPFCQRERKFYVDLESGMWNCKVCGIGGNPIQFLRSLWEASVKATKDYETLKESRRFLHAGTLLAWGCAKSIINGEWLVPGFGYGSEAKLDQLYRYTRLQGEEKFSLIPTTGSGHTLFGMQHFDSSRSTVYIAEGPWDAMALWELLKITKLSGKNAQKDQLYAETGNVDISLLAQVNVLAVPGANVFLKEWLPVLAGKKVILLFDSDHPKPHKQTGELMDPVGWAGMHRVSQMLLSSNTPPSEIHHVSWRVGQAPLSANGYDPKLANGYDVRDLLTSSNPKSADTRIQRLPHLFRRIQPIPAEWVEQGNSQVTVNRGKVRPEAIPCDNWNELTNQLKKALKWTEGLDRTLSVMLAAAASVRLIDDQLWVKIISPPSCGKTSLCEGLAVANKYVKSLSDFNGFSSGYKDLSGENHSPIQDMMDKALVTKDGDGLLKSAHREKILAQARDLYDRVYRSSFLNDQGKDWDGLNMVWILCGTGSMKELDSSELGERFIDCVMMERIDILTEIEINRRKLGRLRWAMANEPTVNGDGADTPEMGLAKRMIGGYVIWLRENIDQRMRRITMSQEAEDQIERLARLTAYMRCRPPKKQDEDVYRELSARLTTQLGKLAYCLAVVLNKDSLDGEVMRRVRQCALDTGRGTTFIITRCLAEVGQIGLTTEEMKIPSGLGHHKIHDLLNFLKKIEAVEIYWWQPDETKVGHNRWRLTKEMKELWGEVMNIEGGSR